MLPKQVFHATENTKVISDALKVQSTGWYGGGIYTFTTFF